MAEPQGDNTKPADGEPTAPNMTKQEYDALTGTASQEEDPPKTENREIKGQEPVSSAATLRTAEPSRVEIAATIASGLVAHGRYAALLRDERMIRELALNSLRVADALISAANPQA
ncbi:hypothetical protein J5W72_11585 [Akkermansia muciniphila]|uniref:hypothetical protein n=2 Tax=Akkermansiaceae TaxID=1647988 RepID=UPI001C05F596|nr:hypothetical protein [Akkermansia muciniphila]QWP36429.1 hypothetical protein J5W72_11585 [Akkermansia muciniphila]